MADYTATVLVDERFFCEAPRWRDGRFWFSDFYAHEVCSVGLDGDVRVELALDGEQPSGLGWLPDGRLLVVAMRARQVLRREPDGSLVVHADLGEIATFHTNDMLVDGDGRAYVGNFGFDLDQTLGAVGVDGLLAALMADPTPYMADLASIAPDGTVSVAAPELVFPNGMVLLDDGATLVVAQTLGFELTAFTRGAEGALTDRRTWAPLAELMVAPDGIAADAAGGIWVANALAPSALRVTQGGTITDSVATSQNAFACAVGGPAGRHVLVCTAPDSHHAVAGAARAGKLEIVELPAR
jgi:sugar lactone lactonase YvrE